MSVSKSGDFKAREGTPFKFFNYTSLTEAEGVSRDIGFPPFCCHWASDGSILVGGGGGTKGTGVRSALIACRLVDGNAAREGRMCEALVDICELRNSLIDPPVQPQLQAVGEISSDNEIVSSISEHDIPSTSSSVCVCSVGNTTCIFDISGFGSLASSPLPPCLPNGVVNLATLEDTLLSTSCRPSHVIPNTPFKSPLLAQARTQPSLLPFFVRELADAGPRRLSLRTRFQTDFSLNGYQNVCVLTPDGSVLLAGGSEGIVRAYLIADPALHSHTHLLGDPLKTPARHSPRLSLSSPLCLTVAKMSGDVQTLSLSLCGSRVCVSTDNPNTPPSIFSVPSPSLLLSHGIRIPIGSVDRDDVEFSKLSLSSRKEPHHSSQSPDQKSILDTLDANAPSPLLSLPSYTSQSMYTVQATFWHPPSLADSSLNEVGSTHVKSRVNSSSHISSATLASADAICSEVARGSGGGLILALERSFREGPVYLTMYSIGEKEVVETGRVLIAKQDIVTKLCISPNKHLVAVATGKDMLVFTGPVPPPARNVHMQALGLATSLVKPLQLIAERKNCFAVAGTGLSFDPSSRLLMGVCGSRAITFLHAYMKSPSTSNSVLSTDDLYMDNLAISKSRRCVIQFCVILLIAVLLGLCNLVLQDSDLPV